MKAVKLFSIFVLVFLFFMTGCQSVVHIDLNEMVKKDSIPLESFESKEKIEYNIYYDQSKLDEEDLAILKLFDHMIINTHFEKNGNNLYLDGIATTYKGDIPFKVSMANDQTVFWIDQAEKPFVIEENYLSEIEDSYSYSYEAVLGTDTEMLFGENYQEIQDTLTDFVIRNLPNPYTMHVHLNKRVTLNGDRVSLHEITTKVTAEEIPDLAIDFLRNIKEDPTLKDIYEMLYISELDAADPLLADTPEAKEELDNQMDEGYQELLLALDEIIAMIEQSIEDEAWKFGDESYLESTLYVDKTMRIKKANGTFVLKIPEAYKQAAEGFLGFDLTYDVERFNINQEFDVSTIDVSNIEYLTEESSEEDFYSSLNKDGVLYDILKNDLHVIPIKTLVLTIDQKEMEVKEDGKDKVIKELEVAPYVKNGRTLVPVRFISENLGADVTWDGQNRQVTITKDEDMVVLTIDSEQAIINGQRVLLETKPEIVDNRTMVPLRFISQAFQAKVFWDGDTRSITIQQFK